MGTIEYSEQAQFAKGSVTVKVDTIPEANIENPKKYSWSFKQLFKFLRTWWSK